MPPSDDRQATIEAKSYKRHDTLHLKLSKMDGDAEKSLFAHLNCVSTFTSETHIARYLKALDKRDDEPIRKRSRRSTVNYFLGRNNVYFVVNHVFFAKIQDILIDGNLRISAKLRIKKLGQYSRIQLWISVTTTMNG